jgi:peroxiredoxin
MRKFVVFVSILMVMVPSRPCLASLLGTKAKIGQGDVLPPFTSRDLKGNEVNLSDHIGRKVILLDFWSIYCAPCVEEMPGLIELYNKYNDMGLEVFGISLDSKFNARRLNKFVEGFEHRIPYPIIHDEKSNIRLLYGVNTLPTTIIVDTGGRVKLFHIGFTKGDKKLIDDYVRKLVSEIKEASASAVAQ